MFSEQIEKAFSESRKLSGIKPSEGQRENIVQRLLQIFTLQELEEMDSLHFLRQVERVWPIARYIDREF